MTERHGCLNNPDNFCFVCRQFTAKTRRKKITSLVKCACHKYLRMKLGDPNKKWSPHVFVSCNTHLTQWLKGKSRMPFLWCENEETTILTVNFAWQILKVSSVISRYSSIKFVPHDVTLPLPDPADEVKVM